MEQSRYNMPNNLFMVEKRFGYLERRLKKDPSTHQMMKKVIDGYLAADPPQARKMTREEVNKLSPRTWYLPIHPVFHPQKPGKVRIVNDAAAAYKGVSLNTSLLSGPDLLQNLAGCLLRFRIGKWQLGRM